MADAGSDAESCFSPRRAPIGSTVLTFPWMAWRSPTHRSTGGRIKPKRECDQPTQKLTGQRTMSGRAGLPAARRARPATATPGARCPFPPESRQCGGQASEPDGKAATALPARRNAIRAHPCDHVAGGIARNCVRRTTSGNRLEALHARECAHRGVDDPLPVGGAVISLQAPGAARPAARNPVGEVQRQAINREHYLLTWIQAYG